MVKVSDFDPERHEVLRAALKYFEAKFGQREFIPGETYIPVTAKSMNENDLMFLLDSSLDLWLTAGRYANQLESKLSAKIGKRPKALLVNSGSSANLLAFSSLCGVSMSSFDLEPIQPGSEVITVASGFPTTVNPIIQNGCIPVFVDITLQTLGVDMAQLENALTKKTKAVIMAHALGNPYRADKIREFCDQHELYLIEDCCDALGAEISGKPAGSFGHYSTLSFYPAHHITMGEGGAVFSETHQLRRVAESMRDWGRDCWCEPGKDNTCGKRFDWKLGSLPAGYDHKYTYSNIGYNLKVTDMQAAVGLSQLERVDDFVFARRENWKKLNSGILDSPVLSENLKPITAEEGTNPSWFGFPMHCADSLNRNRLSRYLEDRKVGTRLFFGGNLVRQPAYKNVDFRQIGDLVNSDRVMEKTFWIAVHPLLTDEMINYMLETLESGVREQL